MEATSYISFVKIHVVLLFVEVTSATVCPYQVCQCTSYQIICQNLGLTSIPPLDPRASSGFSILVLDGNRITAIPAKSLPPNLTTITLSNNPITLIDDSAFNESTNTLHSLMFSGANLSEFPRALTQLRSLKYLNIYDSIVHGWDQNVVSTLGQTLLHLDLVNISMSAWPDWMLNLTQLTELTLDSSSISTVPDQALNFLSNTLFRLSISSGNLETVPKTLANLTALDSLYLRKNQISDVTWLPALSRLSSLSLDGNKIWDPIGLSKALVPYASSLKTLDINGNSLTAIPDLSFLGQINTMDLSHNRMSDPNSGALPPGLYSLDLSSNSFPRVPAVYSVLHSVTTIHLDHNGITSLNQQDIPAQVTIAELGYNLLTQLTSTSFPPNCSLLILKLNDNPLTTISNGAFQNLPSLISISLEHTLLTRMPVALISLGHLQSLNMDNCSSLVCTCMEKSLQAWVTSVQQVFGECGNVGIKTFFTTLSPACPK